jgi:hypothetical protein
MPRGEPQLEAAEAVQVPLPAEPGAVPLQPETAAPIAAPLGARGNDAAGMRDLMALSSPLERRRFVLQLQRTAGNAAVCRWLGVVRDRYTARHTAGDEPPDDVDEPRAR